MAAVNTSHIRLGLMPKLNIAWVKRFDVLREAGADDAFIRRYIRNTNPHERVRAKLFMELQEQGRFEDAALVFQAVPDLIKTQHRHPITIHPQTKDIVIDQGIPPFLHDGRRHGWWIFYLMQQVPSLLREALKAWWHGDCKVSHEAVWDYVEQEVRRSAIHWDYKTSLDVPWLPQHMVDEVETHLMEVYLGRN